MQCLIFIAALRFHDNSGSCHANILMQHGIQGFEKVSKEGYDCNSK